MAVRIERPSRATTSARPALRLEANGTRRRSRVSELVLGIVVVAACALGVVLWHSSTSKTESVLVLARPVRAGEALTADATRVEEVHLGPGVDRVAATDLRAVVGQVAGTDLAAGTLVAPGLFAGPPSIPAGSTVVSAALVPGQFGSFGLRAGEAVDAIRTASPSSGGAPEATVLARATVYEVKPLDDTAGTWIVSLLVPEDAGPAVASAAAGKSLALALVPSGPA
jgi:flagella basal body P-ring formation protein FlgA